MQARPHSWYAVLALRVISPDQVYSSPDPGAIVMTLPKTHPLYGAVEALAIPLFVERTGLLPSEWYRGNLDGYQDSRKQCLKSACETIRALEAAGYRVVGPESIGTMASAVPNPFVRKSMAED